MSDDASIPDILSTVLTRFEDLGNTPLAIRLAEVRIGQTNLWDAIRYEVADAIYDESYRELSPRPPPDSSQVHAGRLHRTYRDIREAVLRNLWQGQVSQEFLVGLLSARFGLVGDLIEKGLFYAHRFGGRQEHGCRIEVLVAGSMYRTAVAALGPVLQRLHRHHRLEYLVLAHDDVLLRHGRVFSRLGMRWCNATIFSDSAHRTAATTIVAAAQMALADPQPSQGPRLPEAVKRKFLSERHLRRLALNFLAAREALSKCGPSVVVIPDERQPLARLLGLEARGRGLAVVSAPLSRDQIYRKIPLWDSVVSTRMLVFSPLASRFLGRAGALSHVFEAVSALPIETHSTNRVSLRSSFREILNLEPRLRIVLFASQGQALNALIVPMLKACVKALPNVNLVIRPHPYESPSLMKLMNPGVSVSRAFTARQAIQAADVLVTHSSFMAVEAALLCCPVILVSPDSVPTLMPLLTEGLARWVRTSEELRCVLENLLGNGHTRVRLAQERFRKEQAKVAGIETAADLIAELTRAPRAATFDKPGEVTPWSSV